MLLQKECESLPKRQREAILNLISLALFEITNAEAKETRLRRKIDTTPQEYFEVIKSKAVVPEVHCKIGGILGDANEEIVKSLGNYGRTFGIVSTIREEFIDLIEYSEFQGRIKNECLPLPMLYALQNSEIRKQIDPLIKSSNFTRTTAKKIVKIILSSKEVQKLKREINMMINEEINRIPFIQKSSLETEAKLLLNALIEEL